MIEAELIRLLGTASERAASLRRLLRESRRECARALTLKRRWRKRALAERHQGYHFARQATVQHAIIHRCLSDLDGREWDADAKELASDIRRALASIGSECEREE